MIRVVAVHTAMALVEPITELFKEHLPEVKLNHIADDSLIQEVIAHNEVTPAVRKRLFSYYHAAVDAGADLIFNICSSVGEVAEAGRLFVPIPILRIDEPMAVRAVKTGKKIGVLATLHTTLAPTVALLKKKAREKNKEIEVVEGLAQGAFQAVMAGDRETHDKLILEASEKIKSKVDLFVLA
ncbi:MAG TPA: aspartate/glutamate racemase family protein, partial [Bacteroidales bacterium]|nr:aspartate/glutamate racemase family protein [Bacteroidales bacterium]